MLTDGQRTTGVDPLEAAKMAADRGVRVYTVGIGTVDGETIGFEGWSMRVRLDEETLKAIANKTSAEYFYAGTAQDLKKVYETLSSKLTVEKKETEISALFAMVAAALALLSAGLSLVWFNRILCERRVLELRFAHPQATRNAQRGAWSQRACSLRLPQARPSMRSVVRRSYALQSSSFPDVSRSVRPQRAASCSSCVTITKAVPRSRARRSISANTRVGRAAVEVAGGLVGQHAGRMRHQRARDRHALALAARQLGGPVLHALLQAHRRQHLRRLRVHRLDRLRAGCAAACPRCPAR